MGSKCLLLYHPPGGGAPSAADAERIVQALHRVCAVAQGRPERQLEARCSQFIQAPVRRVAAAQPPRLLLAERARAGPFAGRHLADPSRALRRPGAARPSQARDASVVAQPRALADIWVLQLPREAPDRAFVCNP
jgi:hypothetical protein